MGFDHNFKSIFFRISLIGCIHVLKTRKLNYFCLLLKGSFHFSSTKGAQVTHSDFVEILYICSNKQIRKSRKFQHQNLSGSRNICIQCQADFTIFSKRDQKSQKVVFLSCYISFFTSGRVFIFSGFIVLNEMM